MKSIYKCLFLLGTFLCCSCELWNPLLEGCTTSTSCNYNQEATKDDGSCIPQVGCNNWCEGDTTVAALELDSCGECGGDNSICTGCMESCAPNFDASASITGDCDYTGIYGTVEHVILYTGNWVSLGGIFLEYTSPIHSMLSKKPS